MRQRKRLGTSLGAITVTELGDLLTIKQTREHIGEKRASRHIVSLTREQAREVRDDLSKRLALHDALAARDEWLAARENAR